MGSILKREVVIRLTYRAMVFLGGVYVCLFETLGRISIVSPSISKDRKMLIEDLYLCLAISIAVAIVAKGWWRLISVALVVIGVWTNYRGWEFENSYDPWRIGIADLGKIVFYPIVVILFSIFIFMLKSILTNDTAFGKRQEQQSGDQ